MSNSDDMIGRIFKTPQGKEYVIEEFRLVPSQAGLSRDFIVRIRPHVLLEPYGNQHQVPSAINPADFRSLSFRFRFPLSYQVDEVGLGHSEEGYKAAILGILESSLHERPKEKLDLNEDGHYLINLPPSS